MKFNILNKITTIQRNNLYLLFCTKNDLNEYIKEVEEEHIPVLNIGMNLSNMLKDCLLSKYLNIETQEYVSQIIEQNAKVVFKGKPPVIALYNLGILFEASLGLDADTILKNISKSVAIIIIWENEKDSNVILHWTEKKNTINLNFSDINTTKIHS